MHLLSTSEKKMLAEMIVENSKANLDYFSFIDIALASFEDIPGFETALPKLDLLDELWRIYSAIAE